MTFEASHVLSAWYILIYILSVLRILYNEKMWLGKNRLTEEESWKIGELEYGMKQGKD